MGPCGTVSHTVHEMGLHVPYALDTDKKVTYKNIFQGTTVHVVNVENFFYYVVGQTEPRLHKYTLKRANNQISIILIVLWLIKEFRKMKCKIIHYI